MKIYDMNTVYLVIFFWGTEYEYETGSKDIHEVENVDEWKDKGEDEMSLTRLFS